MSLVKTGSAFLRMLCEALVLFRVLREQGCGYLLVLVSLVSEIVSHLAFGGGFSLGEGTRDIPSPVSLR